MKRVFNVINLTFGIIGDDGKPVRVQAVIRHVAGRKIGMRAAQKIANQEMSGTDPIVTSIESFIV